MPTARSTSAISPRCFPATYWPAITAQKGSAFSTSPAATATARRSRSGRPGRGEAPRRSASGITPSFARCLPALASPTTGTAKRPIRRTKPLSGAFIKRCMKALMWKNAAFGRRIVRTVKRSLPTGSSWAFARAAALLPGAISATAAGRCWTPTPCVSPGAQTAERSCALARARSCS